MTDAYGGFQPVHIGVKGRLVRRGIDRRAGGQHVVQQDGCLLLAVGVSEGQCSEGPCATGVGRCFVEPAEIEEAAASD